MSPKPQRGVPPAADNHQPRFDEADEPALDDDADGSDADTAIGDVVERPDGYHWVSTDGRHEFGPFATLAEAQADMDGYAGTGNSADLQEAEDALGLNDWDGDDLGTAGDLPGGIDDD